AGGTTMVAVSLPGVVRCPAVVGRQGELAAIGGLLDAVGSGCGGALMLDADAGLGKSRRFAADRVIDQRGSKPGKPASCYAIDGSTLSDREGRGERAPSRRYLQPRFGCLRCNRRGCFVCILRRAGPIICTLSPPQSRSKSSCRCCF